MPKSPRAFRLFFPLLPTRQTLSVLSYVDCGQLITQIVGERSRVGRDLAKLRTIVFPSFVLHSQRAISPRYLITEATGLNSWTRGVTLIARLPFGNSLVRLSVCRPPFDREDAFSSRIDSEPTHATLHVQNPPA